MLWLTNLNLFEELNEFPTKGGGVMNNFQLRATNMMRYRLVDGIYENRIDKRWTHSYIRNKNQLLLA